MFDIDLTYWSELGGRTLTAQEIDANFRALADALQELAQTGVPQKLLDRIEQDPDNSTVTFYFTDGTYYGPFPLPAKPINPRGAWAAGAGYVPGDLVTAPTGAYLALLGHTAAAALADDVAAGRMLELVRNGTDGSDAETSVGVYDPATAYAKGALVTVGAGVAAVTWKATASDIPPGTAPGTDARWIRVSFHPAESLRFRSVGPWPRGTVLGEAVVGRPQTLAQLMAGGLIKAISTQPSFQGGPPGATFGNNGSVTLVRNYTTLVARWVFQAGSNALTMFAWPPADLALEPGDNLRLVVDYDPINGTPTNAFWNDGVTILAALALYETPGA